MKVKEGVHRGAFRQIDRKADLRFFEVHSIVHLLKSRPTGSLRNPLL